MAEPTCQHCHEPKRTGRGRYCNACQKYRQRTGQLPDAEHLEARVYRTATNPRTCHVTAARTIGGRQLRGAGRNQPTTG